MPEDAELDYLMQQDWLTDKELRAYYVLVA